VSGRGTLALVEVAVCRHDQSDEEEVDDVEDEDTQGDLFGGPRDLLLWVLGLCGGQADQLSSSVGECGGDEDSAEAVEAVEEGGPGGVPVIGLSVLARNLFLVSCLLMAYQYFAPR
jgi:hypothetical protein